MKTTLMKINIIACLAFFTLSLACTADKTTNESTSNQQHPLPEGFVELNTAQIKNAGIVSGPTVQQEMSSSLNVNGLTEAPPENTYSISIPLGGYIKKTTLIPGMMVKKGSVLAIMEDQAYVLLQQEYLVARNKVKLAETDYIRQKHLNLTKANSDKLFQQTESEYNHQKIMLNSLAQQLKLIGLNPDLLNERNISSSIAIKAPVNGYITKVNVNTGKYVNATDVLFELVNPGKLMLNLTVLENDASKLKIGQKITCTTNKNPDHKYTATVKLITPHIGDDRSTSVHCELAKGDTGLIPGTYINATIKMNIANVTAVPDEAIVKWENKFYVFTDEGSHKYKITSIDPGISNEGFTEIKSVLPAKDIVIKNAYALLMKMKNSGEEGE